MSDKAKYYRDLERIERRYREAKARERPPPIIRCRCGHTPEDQEIWDVRIDHWRAVYACADCWPEGVERP
jgi:hypothetical protein